MSATEKTCRKKTVLPWDESNLFHRSFGPAQSEFLYKRFLHLIIIF